ncbi:MAG: autotransporter domain-containing protein, partial [Pontiella sp.]|nr:autotransporter domain-containing protein [Pontiella sp.]
GNTLSLSLNSTGLVSIAGDLSLNDALVTGSGTIQFGGNDNQLNIIGANGQLSAGVLFNGGAGTADTVLFSNSVLAVSGTLTNRFENFENLELLDSVLSGSGAVDGFDAVSLTGGRIRPNGTLRVDGDFTVSGTVLEITLGSGQLHVATNFNASQLGAQVTVPTSVASYTNNIVTADGGVSGILDAGTSSISERSLLLDFDFAYTPSNIAVVASLANETLSSTLTYAGSEGIRAGFNSMKNTVFTRTKQLRRNLVATAHLLERTSPEPAGAPDGAMGPGGENIVFDNHIWVQFFSGRGDYDARGASDGFNLYNSGTAIGIDRLIGEALIVGLNYTYAQANARTADGDHLETESYWMGAYGEWISRNGLYIDALAAYGRSEYDSLRVEGSYLGTANYSGRTAGAFADIGQYFHAGNLALSPYAGLHALTVMADEYTETEAAGSQLGMDEFTRSWVEVALGLKARHRFDTRIGRFQTTAYAEWLHDLVNEDVNTTVLPGLSSTIDLARVAPDANVINTGVGLSWIRSDAMEIGVGYHGRLSEDYEEHIGSLMLDIMF